MKADAKPNDTVSQIFIVRCLNQNFQMLLWSLNSTNIAIHFIEWHYGCVSSAGWGQVTIVDCSQSLLTSLKTCCHKWLNCLLRMYCSGSLHRTKDFIYSTTWNNSIIWCLFFLVSSVNTCSKNLVHGNTDNIPCVAIVAWPGMTSSLTSHGWRNNVTKHFVLKFVSYTRIWYKNVPF